MKVIDDIFDWLNKPYFFIIENIFKVFLSVLLGSIVFLFLYFFAPTSIRLLTNNFFLFALNSGFIVTSVFLIFNFVIVKVYPEYFNEETWTIGKHILSFSILIIIASFLNWRLNGYIDFTKNTNIVSYGGFINSLIGIAVFPITIFLYFDERIRRIKRENVSKYIMNNRKIVLKKVLNPTIKQEVNLSINNKETLKFSINDLIYINSEKNYVRIYLKKDTGVQEHFVRKQMLELEDKLNSFTNVIRCHKSYIINTQYIKNITGNARGYYLQFNGVNKEIPVSRKFKKQDLLNLLN